MLKKFDFTQLGQDAPAAFFKSVMKEMAVICSAQGNFIVLDGFNPFAIIDQIFGHFHNNFFSKIFRRFGNLWKTTIIVRPKRVPERVLRFCATPLCEERGVYEGAQSRANEDLKLYLEEYQGER